METPTTEREYKPTFFDRHGPDGMLRLKSFAYGIMVLGLTVPLFGAAAAKMSLGLLATFLFIPACSLVSGAATYATGLYVGNLIGDSVKQVTVGGASTPYEEQFSYQQALVMQGKVDEALESFEAIIAERPAAVDARVRAAELYAGKKANPRRAAELFRAAQSIPTISAGDDVYVTHRLVDLYTGPLGVPGRALVELRRLIDRYPKGTTADRSREALAKLKHQHLS
jgi:hypothetical protein